MIEFRVLKLPALLLFIALFSVGCTSSGLYDWGDYELALYRFYDDPEDYDEYIEALDEIVNESESADRVPPGMYAEYGYVLFLNGESDKALTYFQREKEKWPESAKFMDMMAENVNSVKNPETDQSGDQTDEGDGSDVPVAESEEAT